jgi:hypothetical protein
MIEDCAGSCASSTNQQVHQEASETNVVTLNGQGCKALKASKYDKAADYFSIALQMLQQGLKHASDDIVDRNQEDADYDTVDLPLTLSPLSSSTQWRDSPSESASSSLSCRCMNHEVTAPRLATVGIYKVPRTVSARFSNMCCVSDYNKVASALIFNLALAHHLASFETNAGEQEQQQPDRAHLLQALRAYELVYKLHMEEGQSSLLNPFYAMVTLNNVALVYYSLLDEQRANQCAEALLSSIVWFQYQQEEPSELFLFFSETVQHLILTDSYTALAA